MTGCPQRKLRKEVVTKRRREREAPENKVARGGREKGS